MSTSVVSLHRGFRQKFLNYDDLTAQLCAWKDAFPELAHLTSLGRTEEGRDMWLLTVGPDPGRVRPAVWVDGNMHASELCGSSVALGIAEDMLTLHTTGALRDLPTAVTEPLRSVLFHVFPRMSSDGAECVLETGRWLRSMPRDHRPNRAHIYWRTEDIDGDGLALVMRQKNAGGEFVESPEFQGLLIPRTLEDAGTFYKVYPEGMIENFDGKTIPDPYFLSDNDVDLNRNFPWSWMPEPTQVGAGSFPTSAPEARAVVEFASSHPNIFAWLNLHTFGGVFIRPRGDVSDNRMDQDDLALFRQIGAWGETHVGYPMVSGFEEFTYEPDKPIHGDLSDFAYHQRGTIAYACELWDLFAQIGMKRPKRFVDYYSQLSRDDFHALARWDRENNHGRVLRPWHPFDHPQIGEVEVGGLDPRFGMWNPPFERIDELCTKQSAMWMRVAALCPRVEVHAVRQVKVGDGLSAVEVTVQNMGYLPTYVLNSSKGLSWNEPLYANATTSGCSLLRPEDAHVMIGHLEGWGRGLYNGAEAPYHMRSRGNSHEASHRWVVKGQGVLKLRIGSCRAGWIEKTIEVG